MKNKKITLNRVYDIVEKNSGLKLNALHRRDDYVIARNIFYKISYENIDFVSDYEAHREIGKMTKRSRVMIWHALNNLNNFTKSSQYLYDKCLFDLGLGEESESKELDISNAMLNVLEDLKGMSDAEITEFHLTRLKPYKKSLESRVYNKKIDKVKGALLNI